MEEEKNRLGNPLQIGIMKSAALCIFTFARTYLCIGNELYNYCVFEKQEFRN